MTSRSRPTAAPSTSAPVTTARAARSLLLAVADERVTIVGGRTHLAACPTADGTSARDACFTGDHGLSRRPRRLPLRPRRPVRLLQGRTALRRLRGRRAGGDLRADGDEVWVFDDEGRHTRTVDTLTGTTLYTFSYDGEGRLIGVTDRDNRATAIERDANGQATAIVAPGGARTELDVNAGGLCDRDPRLRRAPRPSSPTTRGGLMTKLVDRRGGQHTFAYDGDGRLTDDDGPSGRSLTLHSRTATHGRHHRDDDDRRRSPDALPHPPARQRRRRADHDRPRGRGQPSCVSKPDGTQRPDRRRRHRGDHRVRPRPPLRAQRARGLEAGDDDAGRADLHAHLHPRRRPLEPHRPVLVHHPDRDHQPRRARRPPVAYTKATRTFSRDQRGQPSRHHTLDAKDSVVPQTQRAWDAPRSTLTYDPQRPRHGQLPRDRSTRPTTATRATGWHRSIDAAGRGSDLHL